MSDACVLLVPGPSGPAEPLVAPRSSSSSQGPAGRRSRPGRRPPNTGSSWLAVAAAAALAVGLDETIVVLGDEDLLELLPGGVTVLLEEGDHTSEASALRVAVDWCSRAGHGSVTVVSIPAATARREVPGRRAGVVLTLGDAAGDPRAWKAVASASEVPVAIGVLQGHRTGPVRLPASSWPLLPLDGQIAALWQGRPELVGEVLLDPLIGAEEPARDARGTSEVPPGVLRASPDAP